MGDEVAAGGGAVSVSDVGAGDAVAGRRSPARCWSPPAGGSIDKRMPEINKAGEN